MAEFDQIFAIDPNNPQSVAENGVVSIYAPGTRNLLSVRAVTGEPLSNPLPVNSRGIGPAFMVDGYTEVAWEAVAPGEVFSGTFKSYKGVLEEALAAKASARDAVTAVPVKIQEAVASGNFRGLPGAPGRDGSNVLPTQEAVVQAQDLVDPLAVRDGVTNTLAALQAADVAAVAAGTALVLRTGVHRVTGSVTLNAQIVVHPGAILKPSNGTVITINGSVDVPARRFIDMSLGGVVVLSNVPQFLPEWWGPTGTSFGGDNASADDSETWRKMLVSASYLPFRQRVLPRAGTTRLWGVVLEDVSVDLGGKTRRIAPARGPATPGDPTKGNGFVVHLKGRSHITGGILDTDGIAGITVVFWTGSRCQVDNSIVRVSGANTVGIWAYVVGGSITPVVKDCFVQGVQGGDNGVGIRYESADGELTNVKVAYCSRGIELLRDSTVLTTVHVWECDTGVWGEGATNTRFATSYIETNRGWGVQLRGSSYVKMDAGTRIWKNGTSISNTGGLYLDGTNGAVSEDNRIDASFDDNIGSAIHLARTQRTTGSPYFVSSLVKAGGAPVTTDGVYIDALSFGTELRVRGPGNSVLGFLRSSPVTGKIVNDQNPLQSMIDYGTRSTRKASPTILGPTNAFIELFYIPAGVGHAYEIEGLLIVDGPVTNDVRFRVRAPNAVGMTGWYAATAVADPAVTSSTSSSVAPATVRDITTDGTTSIIVGTVGTGQKQMITFRGYVSMGTAAATIALQVALANAADNATGTVSFASMTVRRVA